MESVSCDVLVVGSGAGGLSAAITAQYFGCQVLVIEKLVVSGGTTARSGGWLWVPGSPLAAREQATDRIEDARIYIAYQAGNHFDAGRVDAFLANAGAMVSFFENNTEVKFAFGKDYPDYHPDHPGGAEQGQRRAAPNMFRIEVAALLGRLFLRVCDSYPCWRDFSVQPVLFFSQSAPRLFHALETPVGRFIFSPLGKLGAILSIFQIVLRLFHGVLPLGRRWGSKSSDSIGTKLSFGQPDDYSFRLACNVW
jgi:hypothetical protein